MRISVCAPVSRADTVRPFLESILRQTHEEWELILVGQGPLDDPRSQKVREAIDTFAARDRRIRYCHIETRGATRAKNAAILEATTDMIAEIDDDAEAAPDWLETMVAIFQANPDVDVVGGSVLKPPRQRKGLAVCPEVVPADTVYDPASMRTPPNGWNWISCNVGIRRRVFEAVGLYDEYLGPGSIFPAADDTDLMLRFESAGIKMAATPRLIVHHTYGYRYGTKAFLRHQYNYAYGNGGLAAKLVLANDPHGAAWIRYNRQQRLQSWARPFRPNRLLRGLLGWAVFDSAYRRCLADFRVENNLLVLKESHENGSH